jgi:hypothetical protein
LHNGDLVTGFLFGEHDTARHWESDDGSAIVDECQAKGGIEGPSLERREVCHFSRLIDAEKKLSNFEVEGMIKKELWPFFRHPKGDFSSDFIVIHPGIHIYNIVKDGR